MTKPASGSAEAYSSSVYVSRETSPKVPSRSTVSSTRLRSTLISRIIDGIAPGRETIEVVTEASFHIRRNRDVWNRMSDWYQTTHGPQLNTRPMAWGAWAIPEAEVGALGDVSGKTVLEVGCGGGQWSTFLAEAGADPVGLDLCEQQLETARRLMATPYPLVHGDGERLPFRDASFDIVLSDHGAISWADPYKTVPEVARVLRSGGRLAFNTSTPWVYVCHRGGDGPPSERLVHPYFGLHRVDEADGSATFVLGYGDWVRLLRRCSLDIEDLIELRPPTHATTTYEDYITPEWARSWPAESVWVTTRR
jgi:SAM-dependent methyltransferase